MPMTLDEFMKQPSEGTPPVAAPQAQQGPMSLDDFLAGGQPAGGTPTPEPTGGDDTWWQRHGRTVEGAAAAALALLGGPALVRGATSMLRSSGPVGEAMLQAGRNVRAVAAPSTIDESAGRAAASFRAETGTAARGTAIAQHQMEPQWAKIGNADDSARLGFIDYVENRSKGATIPDPELQGLADTTRKLYDDVHKELGTLTYTQKKGFIEDYYRHQWVQDNASNATFSRTGMSSFLKERTIPTISQGIKLGLAPKTTDPVQTTLEYITNARRFIATNKMIEQGLANGDVTLRQLGTKAPFPTTDKWIPLEGSLAQRGGHQLYAKEGWSRVYNNALSSGFTGPAGELVEGLRKTSNNITAAELGFSAYHLTTMVNEAIINDVANSIMNLSKGAIKSAITGLVKSPAAPIRLYRQGQKLEDVYLRTGKSSPELARIADLLERSGGRAVGRTHAKDYEYTAMGNFLKSYQRGALRAEASQYAKDIRGNPFTGVPRTVFSLIGRTMQTITTPLFEYYIPRIKNGAFADNMGQWLATHPGASRAEQEAAARVLWDSVDNRFGELVQDNIFWRRHMKQVAMIAMRSYSWNMGTIREIGGGVLDAASHQMSPRVAYVIALPIVYGTVAAAYQYLKTGQPPQDSDDLIAPRTGGEDPKSGLPERIIMPGYMKDVLGWSEDPVQTAAHKASAFLSTGVSALTGRDWKGDPIAPPDEDPNAPYEQTVPAWLKAYFGLAAENFSPITMRDFMQGSKIGTNLTAPERVLGMQPAGRRFTDPEGYEHSKRRRERLDWRKKQKYDIRQQNIREGGWYKEND